MMPGGRYGRVALGCRPLETGLQIPHRPIGLVPTVEFPTAVVEGAAGADRFVEDDADHVEEVHAAYVTCAV